MEELQDTHGGGPAEDRRRNAAVIEGARGRSDEPAVGRTELGFGELESKHSLLPVRLESTSLRTAGLAQPAEPRHSP